MPSIKRATLRMTLFLGGVLLSGQPPSATTPTANTSEFEVASIKPFVLIPGGMNAGFHMDGAQVTFRGLPLRDYLRIAYEVKLYQIVGPEWLTTAKFDISAKLPDGSSQQQVPAMLQSLLADRFHVVLHKDTKELPAYALIEARGASVKESPPDLDLDAVPEDKAGLNVTASNKGGRSVINLGPGAYFAVTGGKLEGKRLRMVDFADLLSRFVDLPVINMTDLKGRYEISVPCTPEDARAMQIRAAVSLGLNVPSDMAKAAFEASSLDALFSSLQKAGLKLERRKLLLPVLVVDSADKMPSAN